MSDTGQQHAQDDATTPGRRAPRRTVGAAAHSLRIGRLFGIPLQVHWSFLLLLALVGVADWQAGAGAVAGGLVWVAALFACVVAHELAHCLVARRRGGRVLGILLLPIGGVSRMDHLPTSPGDEAAIAAVGPATSLALGGVFLTIGELLGGAMWPPTLVAGSWWARLGWLNLLLGAFNLLPALPMDGGRVLRAALARRLPRLAATRVAVRVARCLALGLVVAGVFYDFWLVLIGFFVFFGAGREESIARVEEYANQPPPAWGSPGTPWWGGPYPPPPPGPGAWPPPPGPAGWEPPPGTPGWPPAPSGPAAWPPPWGQEPRPRHAAIDVRSAVDVAVERRGPDAGRGEPGSEGVGEHD